MQVIAIANQKGGVGKTTSAITLGGIARRNGKRVLLVDLDPHGSLSAYFGLDPETQSPSIYDLFQKPMGEMELLQLVRPSAHEGMDILPASMSMVTLDRQFVGRGGMGLVLDKTLKMLKSEYDIAFLDCPPILGVLMVNALAACSQLLIPVQTEFLAIKGLERMLHTLEMVTRSRKTPLDYRVVPTLFDRRTKASITSLRMLLSRYQKMVWAGAVPVDTQLRDASQAGQSAAWFAPTSHGTQAYCSLMRQVVDLPSAIPSAGEGI